MTLRAARYALFCFVTVCACDKAKDSPERNQSTEAPVQPSAQVLRVPEHDESIIDLSQSSRPALGVGLGEATSYGPQPSRGRCPPDMVVVLNSYCVDRYEVALLDAAQGRLLSPHYPPSKQYTVSLLEQWQRNASKSKGPLGLQLSIPPPPSFQLEEEFEPRAESKAGVLPSGYLTRGLAEVACKNAGKRLCSREEWVRACRGEQDWNFPYGNEYEALACNVHRLSHPASLLHGSASKNHLDPRLNLTQDDQGSLLRVTGATERCVSSWGDDGIYDMVGNLDEWIVDVDGTFLGGFYSRATTQGCQASIDSHAPAYLDYSLGTRCCRDISN